MRILFVHDVIGELGGAEANVRNVADGLRQRGCAVALLYGAGTGNGEERFERIFAERFAWAADWGSAVKAAASWRPDVVYVHKLAHLGVLEALVGSGIPLVRMVHDHDMYCQRSYRYMPWNRRICSRRAGYACAVTCGVVRNRGGVLPVRFAWPGRKLRELASCRRFARHVVVTRFMRDELVLHGFAPERISILPPVPKAAAPDFRATYADPTILFVGQIIRGKGLDVMIEALARCRSRSWNCLVIGDGAHRPRCEAIVDRLRLRSRVRFTGWVPQERLREHYASARVGVVPSMWPEPIATIGLEFMQHALPVVAFDAGGMRDWLIDGENGFLVPYGDRDGLAAALDRFVDDADLARRMGADGLEKGRRWHVYERYLDELRDLLAAECGRGVASA